MKPFDLTPQLQRAATQLLESGAVALVIGYTPGNLPSRTRPVFVFRPADCAKLVLNSHCHNNLVALLSHSHVKGPVAIVAKPCDVRTLTTLLHEKQFARDRVHIISFNCPGMLDESGKAPLGICEMCNLRTPPICDTLLEEEAPSPVLFAAPAVTETTTAPAAPAASEADPFDSLPPAERWKALQEEFSRCIRCYACRQACPMCYCPECFVERSIPRWVGEGSELSDTLIFHLTRAMHAAGRCGECGACARACPMGINLNRLTRKMNRDLFELFGHHAGESPEAAPALSAFKPDDYNDFIK